ncbi:MAG TPA: hypothetical protein VES88_07065 [Gemmatimonadaceae bacterium]|nr:hypothetical protein [Gemmatimonadaceae bacterium]
MKRWAAGNLQSSLDIRSLVRLSFALSLMMLPVVFDRGAIAEAGTLYALGEASNPYWVPSHGLLLYVRAPLVALSACVLVMSPGLLLAIAAGMARTIEIWILSALMLSIISVSVAVGLAQSMAGVPLTGWYFIAIVAATTIGSLGVACWRVFRTDASPPPWTTERAATSLWIIAFVAYATLVVLAPKFYWDSFNGDGAGSFEAVRLLLSQPVPFWDEAAARPWPGITSMLFAYPASWFIRLFGGPEASVRLPWVLYLVALYCSIVALAEVRLRRLSALALWLIALGLSVYATTMAFSATYSPYWADIAMPATQDTLMMVVFFTYILFFLTAHSKWMALAQLLVFVSLPSGQLLIGLWLLAAWLRIRPRPSRAILESGAVLIACLAASTVVPRLLDAFGLPTPGGEYGIGYLVRTYSSLALTEWGRVLFMVVPAGILPAIAMFAWRRHDEVGQALVIVCIGYFIINYVQGYTSLHHFVPSMLLPLVVFWRAAEQPGWQRPALMTAVAASSLVALALSLPRNARPHLVSRDIGLTIEDRVRGYDRSAPETFRRGKLLSRVFPYDWDRRVPKESFGGSPPTWIYYANHRPPSAAPPNYVLQKPTDPRPAGMKLIALDSLGALYGRSDVLHALNLAQRPPAPGGSPIYDVPRDVLFPTAEAHHVTRRFSMKRALGAIGIDAEKLATRMGVKRPE